MKLIPLPARIVLAIDSIKWSLPCPSLLLYEPLDRLIHPPLSVSSQTSAPRDISIFRNVLPTLEELRTLQQTDGRFTTPRHDHYAILSLALLCLGNQFPTQAHNLVTPLSWAEDTHFGFAPPSYYFHKASLDVLAVASYIHSLVHRFECLDYGEFGIMGFSNANFWTKASLQYNQRIPLSDANYTLPLQSIHTEIAKCSKGNVEAQHWCHEHASDPQRWDPRALHQLCAVISQDKEVMGRDESHKYALHSFAQDAATIELKTLLYHCLNQAGFSYESSLMNDVHSDVLALIAANKIFSAHMDAFCTNHVVVVRRVVRSYLDLREIFSAAAGITCRFLNSPACYILPYGTTTPASNHNRLYIWVATKDNVDVSDLVPFLSNTYYGGGSLGKGDAVVLGGNIWDEYVGYFENDWIQAVGCTVDDSKVSFVDTLYGLRGICPTSVILWSKGTIHETF